MDITAFPTLKDTLTKLAKLHVNLPRFERHVDGPILILEGHGVVTYRVAARLLAAGYPSVRIGVPDPKSMTEMAEEEGAEIVEFDWEKPETYEKAVRGGVQTLFCVMPHHKNWEDQFSTFLEVCKKAGVKNFVKLSFYHALSSSSSSHPDHSMPPSSSSDDPFLKIPLVLMHRSCDEKLMKAASITMNYCILFASHFMSNILVYQSDSIRKDGKFYGASAGRGVNYVSPNDVAECAVRILLAPEDHHRVGYTLTGPEAIKDTDVAELLSKHLNKTVSYVDQPLETFASATAKDTDWGPALDVAYLELAKASGTEEHTTRFVTKDIEKICGHAAETFEEYLLAQDYFAPQELAYLKP